MFCLLINYCNKDDQSFESRSMSENIVVFRFEVRMLSSSLIMTVKGLWEGKNKMGKSKIDISDNQPRFKIQSLAFLFHFAQSEESYQISVIFGLLKKGNSHFISWLRNSSAPKRRWLASHSLMCLLKPRVVKKH